MQSLSVEEFLNNGQVILDVRSPKEFDQGHLPGAISFPLFSDEERAIIGTLYKKQGKDKAFKEGLRIVGPKMVDFVSKAESFKAKQLHVYCWRGGMRSGSMAWLLAQAGFDVALLKGGYKQYRNHIMDYFQGPLNLRVLTGLTGSGKTAVLNALGDAGAQVVDLEGIANHKGSSFGNELSTGQASTEHFQNKLYKAFSKLDPQRPIWLEDESISIGRVNLPEPLFRQMKTCAHYLLEVSLDQRLDLLVDEYGQVAPSRLKKATDKISKKLGTEHAQVAKTAIDEKDLRTAASVLLLYYDRQYRKSIEKKKDRVVATIDGRGISPSETANKIIKEHGY